MEQTDSTSSRDQNLPEQRGRNVRGAFQAKNNAPTPTGGEKTSDQADYSRTLPPHAPVDRKGHDSPME
ncbi:hypothetical protein MTO96_051700 [Rhipicephalus appendiculatus]